MSSGKLISYIVRDPEFFSERESEPSDQNCLFWDPRSERQVWGPDFYILTTYLSYLKAYWSLEPSALWLNLQSEDLNNNVSRKCTDLEKRFYFIVSISCFIRWKRWCVLRWGWCQGNTGVYRLFPTLKCRRWRHCGPEYASLNTRDHYCDCHMQQTLC